MPTPRRSQPIDIQVAKIWASAKHNAFTDLVRFKGAWYCTFRESSGHVGGRGRIRILRSRDGRAWSPCALLSLRGIDLRDPKLSITPRGSLMLLAGGTRAVGSRRPRVAFSPDGSCWSDLQPILDEGDWLWRVTWRDGKAYGITYRLQSARRWTISLLCGSDGVSYHEICDLGVGGKPNEATLRFRPDGGAVALVRREGGDTRGWVGTSPPPYTDWHWHSLRYRLGGPNFLVLPDGRMWASTRIIRRAEARLSVGALTETSFDPVFTLPSGGDCSYAGMVWHRKRLWISYYSSHEERTSIYFARLDLSGICFGRRSRTAGAATIKRPG